MKQLLFIASVLIALIWFGAGFGATVHHGPAMAGLMDPKNRVIWILASFAVFCTLVLLIMMIRDKIRTARELAAHKARLEEYRRSVRSDIEDGGSRSFSIHRRR